MQLSSTPPPSQWAMWARFQIWQSLDLLLKRLYNDKTWHHWRVCEPNWPRKGYKACQNEHLAINWENKIQNQKIFLASFNWQGFVQIVIPSVSLVILGGRNKHWPEHRLRLKSRDHYTRHLAPVSVMMFGSCHLILIHYLSTQPLIFK